jgi:cytochrome c biogenesis protein CcmG/thiol:disulfide interchange protein DsbE
VPPSRSRRFQIVAAGLVAALACSEPAPPSYTRLHDRAPRLDDLPGGTRLVVFWATWCPPCREELPGLRALARDPPPALTVVTYGEDEDQEPVRALFGGDPPPELAYRADAGGRAAKAFGVDVLPAAFLVAGSRLVARFDGPRDWNSRGMRRLLARLAGEAPPSAPAGSRPGVDAPPGDR